MVRAGNGATHRGAAALVGDMVVTRSRLEDTLRRIEAHVPFQEWRALQDHSARLERNLRDLREGVMRVRLVPVGEIFRRMPFVVRDLAHDSGCGCASLHRAWRLNGDAACQSRALHSDRQTARAQALRRRIRGALLPCGDFSRNIGASEFPRADAPDTRDPP